MKCITDQAFEVYGRVLTAAYDVTELIEALTLKDAPADDIIYVPSDEGFEALPVGKAIKESFFGGIPVQIGYCNGTGNKLNAVEYHRTSELCIAGTEMIVLVGRQQDITVDFTYDTAQIEAFKVPKGTVFEMYATTLHYAPCSVDGKPFRNIVALPKDTNTGLEGQVTVSGEDKLLVAKNKWLIAHPEAKIVGAFEGLIGENVSV